MSINISNSDSCYILATSKALLGLLPSWEGIPARFVMHVFTSAVSLENSNIFKTELIIFL
jgi:hypothetical protein